MMACVRRHPSVCAAKSAGMDRSLCLARVSLGVAYLTWSALAARRRSGPAAARAVAGILGARQLVQGLLTAGRPARAVLALGAEADVAHSASMIMLGALSRRWRAAAFADALLAGSFAAAGAASARGLPRQEPTGSAPETPGGLRDRCAEALARYLAPSWLAGARLSSRLSRPIPHKLRGTTSCQNAKLQ